MPETAAGLRDQIATAEADIARASTRVETLAARRRNALVTGPTSAAVAVENEQREAAVDVERARIRLEALEDRLRAAQAAERRAAAEAERERTADLLRSKIGLAAEIDGTLAALAVLTRQRRELDVEIRRRWVHHMTDFGDYTASPMLLDHLALRGAVPVELALALGVAEGRGVPLVEADLAVNALARLQDGGAAAPPPRRPAEPEPSGVNVTIGAVPPDRPADPNDLGRNRRLFAPPHHRDLLSQTRSA